jgi:hypothetical protein
MKGRLFVESRSDYERWLAELEKKQTATNVEKKPDSDE